MAYPRARRINNPNEIPRLSLVEMAPAGTYDHLKDKSFEEVVASLADTNKIELAASIIDSIKQTGDPTATKILQGILERQGYSTEKELHIPNERYFEIIKLFAARI